MNNQDFKNDNIIWQLSNHYTALTKFPFTLNTSLPFPKLSRTKSTTSIDFYPPNRLISISRWTKINDPPQTRSSLAWAWNVTELRPKISLLIRGVIEPRKSYLRQPLQSRGGSGRKKGFVTRPPIMQYEIFSLSSFLTLSFLDSFTTIGTRGSATWDANAS